MRQPRTRCADSEWMGAAAPRRVAHPARCAAVFGVAALVFLAGCGPVGGASTPPAVGVDQAQRASYTPTEFNSVDQGTPLDERPAPDFTLTDQFGQRVSLSQLRGKAVVLAFVDDMCTTMCPLTTAMMVEARDRLGPAAAQVQLVGVNVNPDYTAVRDVAAYSRAHGLMNRWLFLTGAKAELTGIWKAYAVYAQANAGGGVVHEAAVYVLDPQGRESRFFGTSPYYGVVPLAADALAQGIAETLPGRPTVAARPAPVGAPVRAPVASPATRVSLPALAAGAQPIALGGNAPRLVVFFASWAPDASAQLAALDSYATQARGSGLPGVVAVDVAPVEPSATQAAGLAAIKGDGLRIPVAVGRSGRVADAYGVQDIPWLALVDHGRVVWHNDGWLDPADLIRAVKKVSRSVPPA